VNALSDLRLCSVCRPDKTHSVASGNGCRMRRERPIRPTVMFWLVGLWQRLSYEIGAITRPRQIIALFLYAVGATLR
ncbi:hypothetical protein AZ030_003367, partial [Escherichia coli]